MLKKEKILNSRFMARLLSMLLVAVMLFDMQGVNVFATAVSQVSENNAEVPEEDENATDIEDEGNYAVTDNDDTGNNNKISFNANDLMVVNDTVAAGALTNPVHHCTKDDANAEVGSDYTDWSYVYFGSYPQGEVTDKNVISDIDNKIEREKLVSNGKGIDVWIGSTKYRRISRSDCNDDQYFNEVSNNGYRYFKWERIKWRVLQNNGSTLFVVADKGLDCTSVYEGYPEAVTWEIGILREWIKNEIYLKAFSETERKAIITQTVVTPDNQNYGTDGGKDTIDNVYLLSIEEATNEKYGFCSNRNGYSASRWMGLSEYSRARGAWKYDENKGECYWYLRSPGWRDFIPSYISSGGYFNDENGGMGDGYAVVPALHIDLSSDLWYLTDDGTSGSGGEIDTVSTPVPNIRSGRYSNAQKISLSTGTNGAKIYYTIDGSKPDKNNGSLYKGTITLMKNVTLKAVAIKDGMRDSGIMEETYTFENSVSTALSVKSIMLGGNAKASVDNDTYAKFFPGSFELKSTLIPVSASKGTRADGSYALKLAIGIGREDILNDETKWCLYKKNVDSISKSKKRYDCLAAFTKQYGGKSGCIFEVNKFKKMPELSALGYYELEIDKNGNVIKNTGMFEVDAKWKGSLDWQFMTPIGPMYLKLEGSGKLAGKLGASYDLKKNDWSVAGGVSFTPGVSLEGGYGLAKVATIGAKGSAELPFEFIPWGKLEVDAKASVHAYVAFVLEATYDLARYKTTIWKASKAKSADTSVAGGLAYEDSALSDAGEDWNHMEIKAEDLSPVDRSYAKHTGTWQGDISNAADSRLNDVDNSTLDLIPKNAGDVTILGMENTGVAASGGSSAVSKHILQTGIMPNSLPIVKCVSGDSVMVFQANDSSRDVLDSSVLKYSVYSGGVWSEPEAVWDNGTCDMYADMQVIRNDLYLVWQKEKSKVTADGNDSEAALEQMAHNSEIAFAKYNKTTKKFENCTYITDDSKVDMMPKIAQNGNRVTVVWTTTDSNSFLEAGDTVSVLYADMDADGTFGAEKRWCKSFDDIRELTAFYYGSGLNVGYITDSADGKTTAVRLAQAGNSVTTVPDDEQTDKVNLRYLNGKLYYCCNGEMKAYGIFNQETEVITAGSGSIASNAMVFDNGNKTEIIWSSPDTDGISRVYASVMTGDAFSEAVELYTTEEAVSHLSGILFSDDSWQLLMNTSATDETGLHSLVFVTKQDVPEVSVGDVSVDNAFVAGENTELSYVVTNTGEQKLTEVNVMITTKDGQNKTVTVPVNIEPGETICDTAEVDLSDITDTTEASVSICANGQTITEENSESVTLAQTDLKLDTVMVESDEDVVIAATVENLSSIPAEAMLTIYGDVEQTKVVDSTDLGEITEDAGASHTFYLDKSALTMNENNAVYLPIVVTSDKTDCNEDNNTIIEAAYGKENGNSGTGNTVSDSGKKPQTASIVKVSSLAITGISQKIAAGKSIQLTAEVSPANATSKSVTWTSSNTKFATVNTSGKVSVKKAGAGKSVVITAKANDGSGVTATYKITIMKDAVKSVKLSAANKTVKAGKSVKVKATVKTTGKKVNKALKWTSSNTDYATVNKSGKVTTKKAGKGKTVTITAQATDGSGKKAKIKIKIK